MIGGSQVGIGLSSARPKQDAFAPHAHGSILARHNHAKAYVVLSHDAFSCRFHSHSRAK